MRSSGLMVIYPKYEELKWISRGYYETAKH